MGAWLCPKCGHGKFVYPYKSLTVMCAREGCGYIDRRDDMRGVEAKKAHLKNLDQEA